MIFQALRAYCYLLNSNIKQGSGQTLDVIVDISCNVAYCLHELSSFFVVAVPVMICDMQREKATGSCTMTQLVTTFKCSYAISYRWITCHKGKVKSHHISKIVLLVKIHIGELLTFSGIIIYLYS